MNEDRIYIDEKRGAEPLRFDEEYSPEDADDPELVKEAARRVKAAVQGLLDRGLEMREGIFT